VTLVAGVGSNQRRAEPAVLRITGPTDFDGQGTNHQAGHKWPVNSWPEVDSTSLSEPCRAAEASAIELANHLSWQGFPP